MSTQASSLSLNPQAELGDTSPEVAPGAEHPSARASLKASGAHAVQAAEELKAAAEAKAREWSSMVDDRTAELRERAEVVYADTKIRLQALQKDTEDYVRANPLKAVLLAAGAGFLLGVLARR